MSKKRKRDGIEIDLDLVEIYERLASEDEETRLDAAHKLLTQIYRPDTSTQEQVTSILSRLFRGLCSGRKAARLGFAVALTELLNDLSKAPPTAGAVTPSQIIDLLESQTRLEGGTSGQDERDHHFGRLFGAEAIIKSDILFTSTDRSQWKRLLDSICSLAQKKPWLREECGWIMYRFATSSSVESRQPYVEDILKTLNAQKLIRTPEGVATWLSARTNYPNADLQSHAWKHKHPLHRNDIKTLGEVMMNAKPQRLDSEYEAQGSAMWSSTLHFAWDSVLINLFQSRSEADSSFEQFWQQVIEESFFGTGTSQERKSWGMLVWTRAMEAAPIDLVEVTLSKNALHCLITALHGQERYLKKVSEKVLDTLKRRLSARLPLESVSTLGHCLLRLWSQTDFAEFDRLTKSNTIKTLLTNPDLDVQKSTFENLAAMSNEFREQDEKVAHQRRKHLLEMQSTLFVSVLKEELSDSESTHDGLSRQIIIHWLSLLHSSTTFSSETRSFLQDRLATGLEQVLRHGFKGRALLIESIHSSKWRCGSDDTLLTFDEDVNKAIEDGFTLLEEIWERNNRDAKSAAGIRPDEKQSPSPVEGASLLLAVVLFEVYCGEAEAIEMLKELADRNLSILASSHPNESEVAETCDSLIEILFSLASRPSKFLRTAVTTIFESISAELSADAIKSLGRILVTKENKDGQEEMFETADAELDDDDDDDDDSDVIMSDGEQSNSDDNEVDSDVEVVNGASDSSTSDSDSDSNAMSPRDDSEDQDGKEDEYTALDAALASALGNSKPNDSNSSHDSDSDSSMSDRTMLALDAKLSSVFREHQTTLSQRKQRKQTARQSKEALLAFKNRVLDLVDVYLKHQSQNPLTLSLLLPLLEAIQTTKAKQFADRCCAVIREHSARCKGGNVPRLLTTSEPNDPDPSSPLSKSNLQSTLTKIHAYAAHPHSNAHASSCSQASLLVTKVLVRSFGTDGAGIAVRVYAETREKQITDPECRVQAQFFSDWGNWCVSARALVLRDDEGWEGEGEREMVSEKEKARGKGSAKGKGKGRERGKGRKKGTTEAEMRLNTSKSQGQMNKKRTSKSRSNGDNKNDKINGTRTNKNKNKRAKSKKQ